MSQANDTGRQEQRPQGDSNASSATAKAGSANSQNTTGRLTSGAKATAEAVTAEKETTAASLSPPTSQHQQNADSATSQTDLDGDHNMLTAQTPTSDQQPQPHPMSKANHDSSSNSDGAITNAATDSATSQTQPGRLEHAKNALLAATAATAEVTEPEQHDEYGHGDADGDTEMTPEDNDGGKKQEQERALKERGADAKSLESTKRGRKAAHRTV
jgi:hypothetical protein